MPRELDISKLQKFSPRKPKAAAEKPPQPKKVQAKAPEPAQPDAWPSREAPKEGQFTIRAPLDEITRFRNICKDDRRTYADMLRILMDSFEKGEGGAS